MYRIYINFFPKLLGDDLEDRLRISSDEEDMDQGQDSDMYILNQRSNNGGPVGVGGPEHLVRCRPRLFLKYRAYQIKK